MGEEPGAFTLGLSHNYREDVQQNTLSQSIEVIRNRVDEFGVAEPAITSQGDDRIVVELPGVKENERAKQLIGRTAKLEFKIADDKDLSPQQLLTLIDKISQEQKLTFTPDMRLSDYVAKLNTYAKGKIPAGTEIAFDREHAVTGGHSGLPGVPYLLYSRADVTGNDLRDAQVGLDPETRAPLVEFELNPGGAENFGRLTGRITGIAWQSCWMASFTRLP